MTIRVLETEYNGARYRSRTEARWAVLFDHAGYDFQYEPEGYDLESGWYVPDFWIPRLDAFFEVKPENVIIEAGYYCLERSLGEDLAYTTGKDVLFGCGSPHELLEISRIKRDGIPPLREWLTSIVSASAISRAKAYRFDWNGMQKPPRAESFGRWQSVGDVGRRLFPRKP